MELLMSTHSKGIFAKSALLSATLIWGSSFFVMKNTIDSIPIYYLLAVRFTVAAVTLMLIFNRSMKKFSLEYLWKGSVLGILLFIAYAFQTYGLLGTTPGKNAFLTTVYCVMVPFLYWAIKKVRPDIFNIAASVICVAGIGLVSLSGDFTIGIGDVLTLICGLFYALHIVAVASFSKDRDIFLLTAVQFGSAAAVSWIFAFLFNTFPKFIEPDSMMEILYLCFFATTLALLLQNVGQKYTPPSTAAIILSLESVFGVLFSILFYNEKLTLKTASGFTLIFVAVIISETKFSFISTLF
ncbi:MAG: DMT family transporter, partial [Bacillota bacterium]|nr:DMT family transporter [Bacillota bacterium]